MAPGLVLRYVLQEIPLRSAQGGTFSGAQKKIGLDAPHVARAGDALTLYPGVYHPPSRLEALPGVWLAWVAADPGASAPSTSFR